MILTLHGEIPCRYFYIQSHLMTFCSGSLQNPAVRVNFMKKSPEIGQSA